MTEPDYPYSKKPKDPIEDKMAPPPIPAEPIPGQPPSSPPLNNPSPTKFSCPKCGKVFNTKEELTMHIETTHQSPKKQV